MPKYDFDQAKIIAESQHSKILKDLGFETDRYGDAKGPCPVHGGDNGRAFSYCGKRHTWQCFTHKCHNLDGCSILGLIKNTKEYTWSEVMEYIERITGKRIASISESDLERSTFIQTQKRQSGELDDYQPTFYPDTILAKTHKDYTYFINRGCSENVLQAYDNFVAIEPYKPLSNRSCFPIRDDLGQIVGFTGRSLDDREPKWKFIAAKRVTGNTLFGLHKSKTYIQKTGVAILVEGILDYLMLVQHGVLNAVCTFGVELHNGQRDLLLKYGAKKLILAYDPDPAGIGASEKIMKKSKLYFDIVNITGIIPVEPSDMSTEQIEEYFGA